MHITPTEQASYFAALAPGANVDLRGTVIDGQLLSQLLAGLTAAGAPGPVFGKAAFETVTFTSDVVLVCATFNDNAYFYGATFTSSADFDAATFSGSAYFNGATFCGDTSFESTTFAGSAHFSSATFTGHASFEQATFASDAYFDSTTFTDLRHFGPVICGDDLSFEGARFNGPQVVVEAAAVSIDLDGALFSGTASLRLRYAEVSMNRAVLTGPTALQAWPAQLAIPMHGPMDEASLIGQGLRPGVKLTGVEGVDAAQLVLTDVNLSDCRFTGAFHLDQIQIGFGCTFPVVPGGLQRRSWIPLRWSPRRTLAEEQYYRAVGQGKAAAGWAHRPEHLEDAAPTPGPGDLTGLYRQLRKAFEDGGNEPDAADFYYGEMEMRRIDPRRPRAERWLLWLYWLASGYGLRASRALAWLGLAMASTTLVLMLIGLPNADPQPVISGSDRAGTVQVVSSTPDPTLTLPLGKRITEPRLQKAVLVVVNSVVFRSSGQNLTTWGTVVEMLSRIGEPVLLTLAALAVRGRIKR